MSVPRAVVVKCTYQWRCVDTVEVIQNKQTATELFIIQPEAEAHSPQKALKATRRDWELKDALRKLRNLEKYIQGISAHTNV